LLLLTASTAVGWALYVNAQSARAEAVAAQGQAEAQAAVARTKEAEARAEAEKARRESERARKVSTFFVHLFDAADPIGLGAHAFGPSPDRGSGLTAQHLLDRGARKLKTELKDDPEVRAT